MAQYNVANGNILLIPGGDFPTRGMMAEGYILGFITLITKLRLASQETTFIFFITELTARRFVERHIRHPEKIVSKAELEDLYA